MKRKLFRQFSNGDFFGLIKQKMYSRVIYESFEELKQAIDKYIYYYNNKSIKAKLTGMSSVEYRK